MYICMCIYVYPYVVPASTTPEVNPGFPEGTHDLAQEPPTTSP